MIMWNPSVFLLCGHRIFLCGQVLNMSPWTNFSITSIRSPIIFPIASSTKIGATVTKLTPIGDVSVSDCFEGRKCWWILNWTPLSRSWANLKGKLIFVNGYNGKGIINWLLTISLDFLMLCPSNNMSVKPSVSLSIYLSIYLSIIL